MNDRPLRPDDPRAELERWGVRLDETVLAPPGTWLRDTLQGTPLCDLDPETAEVFCVLAYHAYVRRQDAQYAAQRAALRGIKLD